MTGVRLAFLALSTTTAFGCLSQDTGDSIPEGDTDTDYYIGYALEIERASLGHDAMSWSYEAYLIGLAELVALHVTQDTSSPWEEDHDFLQGDFDPHGAWDSWFIDLAITDDWQNQTSGESTLFSGEANMESTMLSRMEAWEAGVVADCVVWAGSSADVSLIIESGCREITF